MEMVEREMACVTTVSKAPIARGRSDAISVYFIRETCTLIVLSQPQTRYHPAFSVPHRGMGVALPGVCLLVDTCRGDNPPTLLFAVTECIATGELGTSVDVEDSFGDAANAT